MHAYTLSATGQQLYLEDAKRSWKEDHNHKKKSEREEYVIEWSHLTSNTTQGMSSILATETLVLRPGPNTPCSVILLMHFFC